MTDQLSDNGHLQARSTTTTPGGPSSDEQWFAISSLRIGDSPRLMAEDLGHAKALAEVADLLPPILVHHPSMLVIDGRHRILAAEIRNQTSIRGRYFFGTDEEAFLEGVRANVGHGKPLSLNERRQAADRILAVHPEWSDRAVARICGLAPNSVAARRGRSTAQFEQLSMRIGIDGKVRRVRPRGASRRARGPAAGSPRVSTGNLEEENPEHVGRHPGGEEAGSGAIRTSGPAPRSPRLLGDVAIAAAEGGPEFLSWFEQHHVTRQSWAPFVEMLPISRCYDVIDEANAIAAAWSDFASELRRRVARASHPR